MKHWVLYAITIFWVIFLWVKRYKKPKNEWENELNLRAELESACFNNEQAAIRLIEYEQRLAPYLTDMQAIEHALQRLRDDRKRRN
jgi:hypothetical protein